MGTWQVNQEDTDTATLTYKQSVAPELDISVIRPSTNKEVCLTASVGPRFRSAVYSALREVLPAKFDERFSARRKVRYSELEEHVPRIVQQSLNEAAGHVMQRELGPDSGPPSKTPLLTMNAKPISTEYGVTSICLSLSQDGTCPTQDPEDAPQD